MAVYRVLNSLFSFVISWARVDKNENLENELVVQMELNFVKMSKLVGNEKLSSSTDKLFD